MASNKRIDLGKLETELEKWRGEIPLPCDAVVAMVEELRYWRERGARVADQPAPTETTAHVGRGERKPRCQVCPKCNDGDEPCPYCELAETEGPIAWDGNHLLVSRGGPMTYRAATAADLRAAGFERRGTPARCYVCQTNHAPESWCPEPGAY